MDARSGDAQALLGRGVVQYEESVRASDAVQRGTLLAGAIADFDSVLEKIPGSAEARYDKCRALFESGRHKEALKEIEAYLVLDPGSIWAEDLKRLKTRIQATNFSAVEKEVNQAARARDRPALEILAQVAPYQMPAAIRGAMQRSLEPDSMEAAPNSPHPADQLWAARVMEAAYSSVTGDQSYKPLFEFYSSLTQEERALKWDLDCRLKVLVELHKSGDVAAAMSGIPALEERFTSLNDSWQLFNVHHLRGNSLYFARADYGAALTEYGKMLEIAKRLDSPEMRAKALASLAIVYGEQRKFNDVLRCAEELKKQAMTYNLDYWKAYSCFVSGSLFRRLGQLDRSLLEYTAGLGLAFRIRDEGVLIDILENTGLVMDRLGRLGDARSCYREAYDQQNAFQEGQTEEPVPATILRQLNLLYKQGDLTLRMGDLGAAEKLFKESLESAPTGMRELAARNRIGLAEVYLSQRRMREAGEMLAAIPSSNEYQEINWQARFLKGRLLEDSGDHAAALASLQEATRVLEQLRRNIDPGELRRSFLTERFDPYRAIVAILHQTYDDSRQALDYVDRAKSMTLRERLRLQTPNSGSIPSPPANRPGSENRASAMAVLEYFFVPDRLLIFVESQGRLHTVSQGISIKDLDVQVREYLASVNKGDTAAFAALSRRLFAELIAPVQQELLSGLTGTLVILPDGPLHLLPFAGLQDEQGRFLIERAPIAIAPSRSILNHCVALGESRKSSGDPRILLIDGSASLPHAGDELANLSRLYGRSARRLSPDDLRSGAQAAADAAIIHFAGHSITHEGKPVLLLQTSPSEVYLDSTVISGWKLQQARLVYLAGCDTGTGPLAEGESPWGLIPAFLQAGAPAVIASLLPVDDASTGMLTSRFHELMRQGAAKAEALQKAQLELLKSARSRGTLEPQAWIPYILVGDPR